MRKCPNCGKTDLMYLGENRWKCPWTHCKWSGLIQNTRKGLITKKRVKRPELSCILAYSYSEDVHRQNALFFLRQCFLNQTFKQFELIVVEYVKEGNEIRFPYTDIADKHIILKGDKNLNKGWLMNVGARHASTEKLIFHDADTLFENDFLDKVCWFSLKHKFFNGWSSFRCMPGRDNPLTRIHRGMGCIIGIFYSDRDFFFKELGAYNENYFGYGREDSDVWQRANYFFRGRIPYLDSPITHYYHHWHPIEGINPLDLNDDVGNDMLNYTRKNPQKVIDILTKTKLGQISQPTIIQY